MLPGPNQIVACPHCEALAQYETLTSGNTFGARVWTDGKQIAPMLGSIAICVGWLLPEGSVPGSLGRWNSSSHKLWV